MPSPASYVVHSSRSNQRHLLKPKPVFVTPWLKTIQWQSIELRIKSWPWPGRRCRVWSLPPLHPHLCHSPSCSLCSSHIGLMPVPKQSRLTWGLCQRYFLCLECSAPPPHMTDFLSFKPPFQTDLPYLPGCLNVFMFTFKMVINVLCLLQVCQPHRSWDLGYLVQHLEQRLTPSSRSVS